MELWESRATNYIYILKKTTSQKEPSGLEQQRHIWGKFTLTCHPLMLLNCFAPWLHRSNRLLFSSLHLSALYIQHFIPDLSACEIINSLVKSPDSREGADNQPVVARDLLKLQLRPRLVDQCGLSLLHTSHTHTHFLWCWLLFLSTGRQSLCLGVGVCFFLFRTSLLYFEWEKFKSVR